ncbi:glycosylhydrolase family 18-1 [Diaporthe helianthi]|uniref:Glycosylhydrolase family 18-1 n=1 Tax=Diaporthe helianthi TaxID=158607 RepID=A0A2P5HMU3_DIAHE|nr:glycosylhydrolase family 18-1 [Diaporthe helianthi]
MNPITQFLGLFALALALPASITTAAPLSTVTTCTTTTITTPPLTPGLPKCTTSTTATDLIGASSTTLTLTTTTITMPSSTATSYTTVTAPVPTGATVPEYGQCGGLGYKGPTTCDSPSVCVCTSDWWCQCQAAGTLEEEEGDFGLRHGVGASYDPAETTEGMIPAGQDRSVLVTSTYYWPADAPKTMRSVTEPPWVI